MSSTELQQDLVDGRETNQRTIDDLVLTPIPGDKPAGDNLREDRLWVDLRAARPKPVDPSTNNDWELANPVKTNWESYRKLVEDALCKRSKDIELGLFLVEANTRVHGFIGMRDGLWMLGGLITGFFGIGLHPQADRRGLEIQYNKLHWLNDKFPDVICEIPLTWRSEPENNYSLNYYRESRRPNGMIDAAAFDAASAAGTKEQYAELLVSIQEAQAELIRFKQVATEIYGSGVSSLSDTDETLKECATAVQSILRKRGPGNARREGGPTNHDTPPVPPPVQPVALADGGTRAGGDAWSQCEQMVRNGDIDGALATMTALASMEPNGRVRFHRKLLLADMCLQSNRKKLASAILEELNEIIEHHKLEAWETSEIVGGVWARLVRCYRDQAAGTADRNRELEFFHKLSRLDPWQALVCGEPLKEN
jgi:type VI secretion system protein ImpA